MIRQISLIIAINIQVAIYTDLIKSDILSKE